MKSKAPLWWFLLVVACFAVAFVLFAPKHGEKARPASMASHSSKAPLALSPSTTSTGTAPAGPQGASAPTLLAQNVPPPPIFERQVIASGWRTQTSPKLTDFADWTDRYTAAAPADRATLVTEGVTLAKVRRAEMLSLIRTNPREALISAVPLVVRGQLPTAVLDQLEQRVSGEGDLYRVAGLPGPEMATVVPTVETATVNGDIYAAHRYGERAQAAYLRDASIHGVALDKELAVSSSPIREVEPGENTPSTPGGYCMLAEVTNTPPTDPQPGLTTYQVGNKLDTTCCPFCTNNFTALEQRLLRAEQAGLSLEEAMKDSIMSLGDGGVTGSAGNTNKPPVSWTNGPKKIIFMRVDFSDKTWPANELDGHTGNDMSIAGLNNQVSKTDGMAARTLRMSYGLSSIANVGITPVMRMPRLTTDYWVPANGTNMYNYWDPIQADARAAAIALGYNMSDYVCYVVVHPWFYDNGTAAWGGGGKIWCNGNVDAKVLEHEYGHVFWLPHANSYTSADGNVLSAARKHVEYGDAADTMGNAWGSNLYSDFNVYFKSFCNWLPDAAVQTITHAGTYRLYQNDGSSATPYPRALKINRNGSYDWWLGFRGTPVPQNLFAQGVSILEVTPNTMSDTHLLDMNDPTTDTGNAPLSQGQIFNDTADGITLTNAGRGGYGDSQYIYVKVAFTSNHVTAPRPIVNGGIYRFRNKYYNSYLDVPNNTTAAAALLRLAASNSTDSQKWLARRNADGTYSFNHLNTDQWIDVSGNSGGDKATIGQYYSNGVDGQCWAAMPTADGYVEFRHRNTNQVLSADTANNGNMIQYPENALNEQKWTPELVGITEGTYKIAPRVAPALVLDLANRGAASGGQVQTALPNGSKSQLWTVKYNGTSTQFRLINGSSATRAVGLASGAGSANGASVVVADGTATNDQLWTFTAVGSSWINLTPASLITSILTVPGQSVTAGTSLIINSPAGATGQQFQFLDPDL